MLEGGGRVVLGLGPVEGSSGADVVDGAGDGPPGDVADGERDDDALLDGRIDDGGDPDGLVHPARGLSEAASGVGDVFGDLAVGWASGVDAQAEEQAVLEAAVGGTLEGPVPVDEERVGGVDLVEGRTRNPDQAGGEVGAVGRVPFNAAVIFVVELLHDRAKLTAATWAGSALRHGGSGAETARW